MKKIQILKNNMSSTTVLSIAILLCLLFSLLLLPFGINAMIGFETIGGVELYSEEIADYCLVEFPKLFYKDLSKSFDMENFVGTANVGSFITKDGNSYEMYIVSEKLLTDMPIKGYSFRKQKPKDYREAYAPINFKNDYDIGDFLEVSCDKGVYEYKQKIRIIGFTDKDFYDFDHMNFRMGGSVTQQFLIYDDIPPYSKIYEGLMMSDKTPEFYKNLGAKAMTLRQANERKQKKWISSDNMLYFVVSLMILLIIAISANYYFSADKMIKRNGVMAIFGGKSKDFVLVEAVKLMILFAFAFLIATICIAIMLISTNGIVSWSSYFIAVAVTFATYVLSVIPGFIKIAKFKPLRALSNDNVE